MKIPYFSKFTIKILLIAIAVIALALRFYNITQHNFIFYDEGMYLDYQRDFLKIVAANPPKNISEFFIILKLIFNGVLVTPKALWFFLVNLRVFIVGDEGYYFSRLLSALSGVATIGVTFLWAKKYFKSTQIAVMSVLILALLPSHVFYSRQGMQESLSCLLFMGSLYAFIFSNRGFSFMVVMSGILMFAVFLTNYRMIIGPFFIVLILVYERFVLKKSFDVKKLGVFIVSFLLGFLVLAVLENGVNLKANLAWMMNQADESGGYRAWYNFLSYPYYIFKLENVIFGLLFFCSCYFIVKRQWRGLLPFFIVIVQMSLFSFAAEKGSRYLCVVLPFMCMATAYVLVQFYQFYQRIAVGIGLFMFVGFLFTLFSLATSTTAYEKAVMTVKKMDQQALILSTQPMIEKLFVPNSKDVHALPNNILQTTDLVNNGYRYLIIDPQLYVSWTQDHKRFSLEEKDFIVQLRRQSRLIARLPHLNATLLERFVLDHNQDLLQSLHFLKHAKDLGDIYIYDLEV